MAKSDGTVYIDTRVDTKGFSKGMDTVEKRVNGLGASFSKLGLAIAAAFSIKKLIDFSKKAIELGSDLQEVENVVDTVFTTMSEKVDEFAKGAAEAAGLSETMAKRYVGTFGAMAKAFGFAESEAFTMSTALTQLAGDVASFYNITQDEAYTKLKSVFTGETESLKDLGVVMTQNALDAFAMAEGLGKTTKQMTEQEKVALRYRFVLNQLSDASGDFQRTSDGWANQMRILKLNVESIMAAFGQGLINFFTPIIKMINTLLSKIATLANAFKSFSEMIMGKKSETQNGAIKQAASDLQDLSSGYGDSAENAEKLTDATKEATKANKKYFSGLDEIRTYQSQENAINFPVGGNITGEPVDFGTLNTEAEETSTILDALVERAKELAEIFKNGFKDGLGDFEGRINTIKDGIASIKNSLTEIFTDPEVVQSANNFVDSFVYALGQITGAVVSIGLSVAAGIVGGFAQYLEENKDWIKEKLISIFDIGTEINQMAGNFASAIAYIFESFGGEDAQRFWSNIIGIVSNALLGALEIAGKFARDVVNIITKPFIENKEKFRTSFEGYFSFFADIFGTIKQGVDDTIAKLNEVYDAHFKPMFDSLAQGISDLTGSFLDFWNGSVQPILDQWAEKFDVLWKEHIQPFVDEVAELLGSLADLIKAIWENVLVPVLQWLIDNVLPVLLPIFNSMYETFVFVFGIIFETLGNLISIVKEVINFIVAIINGDWSGAWEAAKNIVVNVFNTIKDFISSILSGIWETIKSVLRSIFTDFDTKFNEIKNTVSTIWEAIKILTSSFTDALGDGISTALNLIKETWDSIWDSFSEKISSVWETITGVVSGAVDKIKGWIDEILGLFDDTEKKASKISGRSWSSGISSIVIPSIPSYGGYSVNVPQLATGAVIPPNAPFVAMLGDQRHGTNIEAPLDTIKQAVREVVGANGAVYHFVAQLNGQTLFEQFVSQAELVQMSTGSNPLAL